MNIEGGSRYRIGNLNYFEVPKALNNLTGDWLQESTWPISKRVEGRLRGQGRVIPETKLKFVLLVFAAIPFNAAHGIQKSSGGNGWNVNSMSPALWFSLRFCPVIWTVANLG
jgi:hypothetical protein